MKVLVTGGAGFIGSKVVDLLFRAGHDITVIDSLAKQIHGPNPSESQLFKSLNGKCLFIERKVEEISDWSEFLSGKDALIHLAAETGTGQSMYEISRYHSVNATATANICQYLVDNEVALRVVAIASSRSIYGEGAYACDLHGRRQGTTRNFVNLSDGIFDPGCDVCNLPMNAVPTREGDNVRPASIYALTKYYQEANLEIVCSTKGLNFFGLRLQNVYGPGQSLNNPYTGILSIFSNLILDGEEIDVFEDGHESRDFVYVDDVSQVFVDAIRYDGVFCGAMNVGSGEPTSVLDVIQHLSLHLKQKVNFEVSGHFRYGDIRHNFADTTKMESILGKKDFVKFADGVDIFCKWVLAQDKGRIDYLGSMNELKERGMMGGKESHIVPKSGD